MPDHLHHSTPALTSRAYEGVGDLSKMLDLLMEARSQTNDWHCAHVGELLWNYLVLSSHLPEREHIRLWHDRDGKLAGYALLREGPSVDWEVLPRYEGAGIEEGALAWVEGRLAELRARDPEKWKKKLGTGARADDAQRIAFLDEHGFHPGKYAEVNMIRSLEGPIPAATVPAGYVLRAVEAKDVHSRAEAERVVWFPCSDGDISDENYARLMTLPGYVRELDLAAVTPDGIVASNLNAWPDPVNRIGDFGPVGTRAEHRRKGLQRALLLEGMRRLKEHGMERVCVSTGVENLAAQALYLSVGFQIVNRWQEWVQGE
jgi:ribosomal protein S18 acetylase RimI-like enzyme